MSIHPSFETVEVRGRKAQRVLVGANGATRSTVNIIPKEEIVDRIYGFSHQVLGNVLHGTDATFIPILNGSINFYATLSHYVNEGSHVELMPVQASSYGSESRSGEVSVSSDLIIPKKIENRTLIILDDVLETGKTAAEVIQLIEPYKLARIITVFLLQKKSDTPPLTKPDYWLFNVHPESWVFGFGMDLDEKYRHLRYVCDDKVELYNRDGRPLY